MPTSKRLYSSNSTDPKADQAQQNPKRGLRGSMNASGVYATKKLKGTGVAATTQAGETLRTTGADGLGGTGQTKRQKQAILDGDAIPVGSGIVAALATFTVATGAGAAGTFDATPANDGGSCEVLVYKQNAADATEDGPDQTAAGGPPAGGHGFMGAFEMLADGAAHSVALGAANASAAVAVYARRISGTSPNIKRGRFFATRRTVTAHA
jgi:hypothetical protein